MLTMLAWAALASGILGAVFMWGYYLGIVHGAPAWRLWALEQQAKRNASTLDKER